MRAVLRFFFEFILSVRFCVGFPLFYVRYVCDYIVCVDALDPAVLFNN